MKKNYVLMSGLILASTLGFSQSLSTKLLEYQTRSALSIHSDADMDPDLLIKKKEKSTKAYNDTLFYEDFNSAIPASWSVVNNNQNNFVWKWDDQYDTGPFSPNTTAINSTTASNGFLSLPSDFYNLGTGGISMDTYVESPIIKNGANPMPNTVLVTFQQYYRFCCAGTDAQTLQVSTDNFVTFDEYDMTPGEVGNAANTTDAIGGETTVINISCTAGRADSVSLRIYANGHSNYWWMIDDFAIVEGAQNDISLDDPYLEFNETNYIYYPFYGQIPYDLFPPLPLFGRLTNEGSVDQTNVELVGGVTHLNTPGGGPATGVGSVYNISTLSPGGGTIIGPLCDSQVSVLTGTPRFVPLQLGTFEASWNVVSDSIDQNKSNNEAARIFSTTDTIFARDDGGLSGAIGSGSFVSAPGGPSGGTAVGDRFGSMYIVESRSGNGTANIPTSVSFVVSTSTENTGIEIVPKIWEYDEDSLNTTPGGLDEAFGNEVASTFLPYTVTANDLGNTLTIPLTTGTALTNGLDSGQYVVGWEVTNLPMGTTFSVQNDASSAPFLPVLTTFNYFGHAPANGWGFVQGNPAIRLNMGNLNIPTSAADVKTVNSTFAVNPNPSNGELTINLSTEVATNYTLNVRNMLGQTVYTGLITANGPTTERLDLTDLDKGVYFVTLENENEKLLKKVVLK